MVQNMEPTSYLDHLLQDGVIVIIEIDWSHFPPHFVENPMDAMIDTGTLGKMAPPKVSIRSIPKLSVPKPIIRPSLRFEEPPIEFRTLEMTETGLFVVCDPVHLLPEGSTPKGEIRCSYAKS